MSMSYYANFGFGLMITEPEIIHNFVVKATDDYPDIDEGSVCNLGST